MEIFIIGVIILVSFLLVIIILAQNPKGGLSSQFGGSGTSNLIGVKKTGDLLENITWSLAVALFVLTLSMNFVTNEPNTGFTSPNIERAQEQSAIPQLDLDAPNEGTEPSSTPAEDQGSLDDLTADPEDQQ